MANRMRVSRAALDPLALLGLNLFIGWYLQESRLDLSRTQRNMHDVFKYMNEVYNGGHGQYFCNCSKWDHEQVVFALDAIGATEHSANLENAIEGEKIGIDVSRFDQQFVASSQKIETCMEAYFREHEAEFIEWVP